jgi:hypothetical protein
MGSSSVEVRFLHVGRCACTAGIDSGQPTREANPTQTAKIANAFSLSCGTGASDATITACSAERARLRVSLVCKLTCNQSGKRAVATNKHLLKQ